MEIPALSISSTDIRNRATAAMTIRSLVPDAVEQYIRKFSLYRSEHSRLPAITDINKRLYPLLTPKRFKHTQGVASEAYRLAQRYGLDKEKAYIAGLLHDCAKCYSSEEQLKLCKKYGVKVDKYIKEQPQLAHSFLGEKLAQDLFGVEDEEVLSSIKYHTTGKADMSMFDKVIYIADCIEPFREPYEGLEEIRSLAYKDINKAMICALEHTIEYNEKKGAVIHPLSKEALEFLKTTIVIVLQRYLNDFDQNVSLIPVVSANTYARRTAFKCRHHTAVCHAHILLIQAQTGIAHKTVTVKGHAQIVFAANV